MTRDEILRMAEKAGLGNCARKEVGKFFRAAYAAGVAAERKACEKACKKIAREYSEPGNRSSAYAWGASLCRAAIRERGEKK